MLISICSGQIPCDTLFLAYVIFLVKPGPDLVLCCELLYMFGDSLYNYICSFLHKRNIQAFKNKTFIENNVSGLSQVKDDLQLSSQMFFFSII